MFKKLVQYVMVGLLAIAPVGGLLSAQTTKVAAASTPVSLPTTLKSMRVQQLRSTQQLDKSYTNKMRIRRCQSLR